MQPRLREARASLAFTKRQASLRDGNTDALGGTFHLDEDGEEVPVARGKLRSARRSLLYTAGGAYFSSTRSFLFIEDQACLAHCLEVSSKIKQIEKYRFSRSLSLGYQHGHGKPRVSPSPRASPQRLAVLSTASSRQPPLA